jgi:hypothetical protein
MENSSFNPSLTLWIVASFCQKKKNLIFSSLLQHTGPQFRCFGNTFGLFSDKMTHSNTGTCFGPKPWIYIIVILQLLILIRDFSAFKICKLQTTTINARISQLFIEIQLQWKLVGQSPYHGCPKSVSKVKIVFKTLQLKLAYQMVLKV